MKVVCPQIKDEHLEAFSTKVQVKHLSKKQTIFKYGAIQRHVVYVVEGLAKAYYIDKNGEEKTSWFIKENEFATDYPSYLVQSPSNYIFETLEDSILVYLPKDAIEKAYEAFPPVQKYGRLIAEEILKIQQGRIESFLFKTAKERYLDFIECYPNLAQRVSIRDLASFIGIERQSLTRIRKQIFLDNPKS